MTIQKIYIARHGFRSNWLPPPHPPNPTGIDSDPVLAPHGEDQAVELANYIKQLPEKPEFIISSPFYRCVQTSSPIALNLGLKVTIDRGVGEWFKVNRGVVPIPADYGKLRPFFEDVIGDSEIWDGTSIIPNAAGETEDQIFDRCGRFWSEFIPKFEAKYPNISTILIVTHAATKIALGMKLLQCKSLHQNVEFEGVQTKLRAGACSLDLYIFEKEGWKLKENGRTDFLEKGEEMNWNFDAKFEAGSDEDIKARQEAQAQAQVDKQEETEAEEFEVRSQL